jgi:hypothetical protein
LTRILLLGPSSLVKTVLGREIQANPYSGQIGSLRLARFELLRPEGGEGKKKRQKKSGNLTKSSWEVIK